MSRLQFLREMISQTVPRKLRAEFFLRRGRGGTDPLTANVRDSSPCNLHEIWYFRRANESNFTGRFTGIVVWDGKCVLLSDLSPLGAPKSRLYSKFFSGKTLQLIDLQPLTLRYIITGDY